ncbi:MAG: hypothetical protein EPO39_11670 [Candidatus Manganitrophaceae bacterium]|nr:MAG: hypothetical protein EPO39_11670 [Candidatus Manganitrophaceae bacterium]
MPKEDVWAIEDPWEKPSPAARKNPKKTLEAKQKRRGGHPAVAFSLSLFLWGAGQIYNGQGKLGVLFLLIMANFYTLLGMIWFYGGLLASLLAPFQITPFEIFVAGALFYLCGLLLWFVSAVQAYDQSARGRPPGEKGVSSLWPPLCSLLLPGWGQLLNCQRKKGIFFLLMTLSGLLAVPALWVIPQIWPKVDRAAERLLLEKILLAALLFIPFFFLTWIIAIYDAGRIALDPDKKEPLPNRIRYAVNRLRIKGWTRGVLPHLEVVVMLSLFLAFFLVYSHYYFPKKFYADRLGSLQRTLSEEGMVLLPKVIDRALSETDSDRKNVLTPLPPSPPAPPL